MKRIISVCGSDEIDKNLSRNALKIAENVGQYIAKRGGVLLCGGRGGIMNAVCKGAKKEKGLTIGLLPEKKYEANKFVDIPIATGLGMMRNALVVYASDAVIAIGGRWGTMNEISYSKIFEKPLILIKNTGGSVDKIIESNLLKNQKSKIYIVNSAKDAVEKAFEASAD
jgi:uncharacterized protein (TIGR00725 family)